MPEQQKLEKWTIFFKLKKVVRIVLYGQAIRQSDCEKATPYQLHIIKSKHSVEQFSSNQKASPKGPLCHLCL